MGQRGLCGCALWSVLGLCSSCLHRYFIILLHSVQTLHHSQNVHVFLFLSAILFFIHTQQKQFFVSFSVSRALGIPCRVVTNYLSAHDTNSNLAIEHYFNEKGEPDGTSRDMIWYKQMHYLHIPCMVSIFGYSANVQTASLSFLIIMDYL